MTDIPSSIEGPAYIAMKSKSEDWLDTGVYQTAGVLLPYHADDPKEGPPGPPDISRDATSGAPAGGSFYYAPVREIKTHVDREYGGINSSGGPQVSGRCDHQDFFVEKNCDKTSSILYQHCCSGEQMSWVHLAILQDGRTYGAIKDPPDSDNIVIPEYKAPDRMLLHIRLKDVSITSYEMSGVRFFGSKSTDTDTGSLRSPSFTGVGHVERFTLLFTAMSIEYDGIARGWDTGTDVKWPD